MPEIQKKISETDGSSAKKIDRMDENKSAIMDKIVKKNEDIAWRVLEGEVIIITPQDSTQHYMNEVGSTIWEFADGNRSVREIIDMMKNEYRENIENKLITEQDIENDVVSFLKELSSDEKNIVFLE